MRRLLCIALVAGCGFATPQDFTGRRIGDGVGPWEDRGALEMCLTNDRVGPPASAPGGFCQPQATPDEALCTADADCRTRERCVCGRCTVEFCSTSGECGADHVCTFATHRCDLPCTSSDQCPGEDSCVNGVCAGGCSVTADCQAGEVCNSMGRCIVADCSADANCKPGEICKLQREPRATAQPTVLADLGPAGRVFTMWFEMSSNVPQTQFAIFRATSKDGLAYTIDPAAPVLADGGDAHAPSVIRDASGNGFVMFYETAAGIRTATSADGITWGAPSTAIAGDWHAPAAVTDQLVFVTRGARDGIALWRGSGTPQVVYGNAEVTDPVLWRAVQRVGDPFAIASDSPSGPTLRVWFDAFGTESGSSVQFGQIVAIKPNDSIGYAAAPLASPDQLITYPFNPVFDRVVAFLDHRSEQAPAVVQLPGREVWFLYYQGASADGATQEGLGVAVNK